MKNPSIKRGEKRGDRKIDVEMEKVVSSQERTGLRAHKLHKKYVNQEMGQSHVSEQSLSQKNLKVTISDT